jgi:hypothetical protein
MNLQVQGRRSSGASATSVGAYTEWIPGAGGGDGSVLVDDGTTPNPVVAPNTLSARPSLDDDGDSLQRSGSSAASLGYGTVTPQRKSDDGGALS